MNFWGKSENIFLTFPNTKLHAKNQKNLSRGSPGKLIERARQTERQTETDPNIRVLPTLSLTRRTIKCLKEFKVVDGALKL